MKGLSDDEEQLHLWSGHSLRCCAAAAASCQASQASTYRGDESEAMHLYVVLPTFLHTDAGIYK
jgi:hypothetical protein